MKPFPRIRQRLGKYRIDKHIADSGFASVFMASDTFACIHVALKIPSPYLLGRDELDMFRKEVRLTSRLDHPSILPIKDAGYIDKWFVIVYPLGKCSLETRLAKRISLPVKAAFAEQMLDAVAHAHKKNIIHCDIKPENFILFDDNRLRLADFGIARFSSKKLSASGSGTVGYIAPEQAMGKPSMRSDVFSLGLTLYRMFTGRLPEWPFRWPPPGCERLYRTTPRGFIDFFKRAIDINPHKRFPNAQAMQRAFRKIKPQLLRSHTAVQKKRREKTTKKHTTSWKAVRNTEFQKKYGKKLATEYICTNCSSPLSETMRFCPWCGADHLVHRGDAVAGPRCPRCKRSVKKDWTFCPWCYGAAINTGSRMKYRDKRYTARCSNPQCKDKLVMPFMYYCPWCRHKIKRRWKIETSDHRCSRCRWPVLPDFWSYCPWCGKTLAKKPAS